MSIQNLPELRNLMKYLGPHPRSPRQKNRLNETDSELVRLSQNLHLALTTDSLTDEISWGLYREEKTIGWMAAVCSLSDLSAVGAKPLGLLLSTQWKSEWQSGTGVARKRKIMKGFHSALAAAQTYLLGGDQGTSAETVLTSTGIGLIEGPTISRIGQRPGDLLIYVGNLGIGACLAFRVLLNLADSEFPEKYFCPRALISEGQKLRKVATSLMDVSDGFANTIFTLAEMNNVTYDIHMNPSHFEPKSFRFCVKQKIPLPALLFAEHGDYQLIGTLPEMRARKVLQRMPMVKVIGRVQRQSTGHSFSWCKGPARPVDWGWTARQQKKNLRAYRSELAEIFRLGRFLASNPCE